MSSGRPGRGQTAVMSSPLDAFRLDGRVAVVTGAAGASGLGISQMFAAAGATVVLADLHARLVAEVAAGLGMAGLGLDVTDQAAVEALAGDVLAQHGRLDVWVNNAAIISDASPLSMTAEDLDRVMAVNFKGVVFGSQAAAMRMIAAGRGSIVNLTSGAVDMPMGWVGSYSTSKAAAHQFTRSLAVEVAPKGVRVNAIAPGWVLTPMNERHIRGTDGTVADEDRAALTRQRVAGIPLGRAGTPQDIAFAALYLASDASSFVTGNTIRPNGGMTMPW